MLALGRAGEPAVVVFSDRADLWWLRALPRGFRHCFVLLRGRDGWVAVEALSNGIIISELPDETPERVAGAYRRVGCRAVVVRCRPRVARALPWAPFSCVESVKRLIGLRAPAVWTPRQLWRKIR
ncbi:MAG: hypothetical protein RIC16_14950 [Rhodospirillales bacterium]